MLWIVELLSSSLFIK